MCTKLEVETSLRECVDSYKKVLSLLHSRRIGEAIVIVNDVLLKNGGIVDGV